MTKELYFCDNCKKQVEHLTDQNLYLKYWFGQGMMSRTSMELCDNCLNDIADKLTEIPWINKMVNKNE